MFIRFVKPIVLGVCVSQFFLMSIAWGVDAADVVIHNKALDVTREKIMHEFSLQPKEMQTKLKHNDLAFRKFVDAINNELLFEAEVNKSNLKADPIVAQKVEIAVRKALIGELIAQKNASLKVPNFEPLALAEYKAHPEKYLGEEGVNARHILLKFNPKNKAEKMALLESIRKKVAAGESFAVLAKQYSEDKGSAEKGGELGLFGRGKTVKPFEAAAFALKKPNELSGVVETQFGLHLIQLIEHVPVQRQKFEVVKAAIVESMRQDYLKTEMDHWRNVILDVKNSKLNETELDKLIGEVRKLPE